MKDTDVFRLVLHVFYQKNNWFRPSFQFNTSTNKKTKVKRIIVYEAHALETSNNSDKDYLTALCKIAYGERLI